MAAISNRCNSLMAWAMMDKTRMIWEMIPTIMNMMLVITHINENI